MFLKTYCLNGFSVYRTELYVLWGFYLAVGTSNARFRRIPTLTVYYSQLFFALLGNLASPLFVGFARHKKRNKQTTSTIFSSGLLVGLSVPLSAIHLTSFSNLQSLSLTPCPSWLFYGHPIHLLATRPQTSRRMNGGRFLAVPASKREKQESLECKVGESLHRYKP